MDVTLKAAIIAALQKVKDAYSKEFAETIESLFRNETSHFTSGNFSKTLSPGMEVAHANGHWIEGIPYGWTSLQHFWDTNPQWKPNGTYDQVENSSMMASSRGVRRFICFPDIEASVMSVAFLIDSRGGDGGSWFSINDKAARDKYSNYLKQIIPHFVIENVK